MVACVVRLIVNVCAYHSAMAAPGEINMTRDQFTEEIIRETLRAYFGVESGFANFESDRYKYTRQRVKAALERILKEHKEIT